MINRDGFLQALAARRTGEVVVTTMGAVRPWGRLSSHPLDLASADSAMGHAADLALGIALARPDRTVLCLNGDGSMLMTLGTLATIVDSGVTNLVLFVLANGTFEITGNQPVPARGTVDYAAVAKAIGFPFTFTIQSDSEMEEILDKVLPAPGPALVDVRVRPGSEGPISRSGRESSRYLQESLAESARSVKQALALTPAG